MQHKRLTIICGHYGSGKTNIAVNMALHIRTAHENVALADLDIVNPYFRAEDSRTALNEAGIKLICSEFANSNLDVPALPQEMYSLIDNKSLFAVLDIGGDDRGALALGRLTPYILEENNYEMLLVINRFRPLTMDAPSTVEIMREIELAGGIRFTGIINNSNLGQETNAETILSSVDYGKKVSALAGIPVVMTTAEESLLPQLENRIPDLFPLRLKHYGE